MNTIEELERQISTYKEDQRVSSVAYNFLHAEYTKLHAAASAMGDTALRNEIATYIHSLPSKGKTIK